MGTCVHHHSTASGRQFCENRGSAAQPAAKTDRGPHADPGGAALLRAAVESVENQKPQGGWVHGLTDHQIRVYPLEHFAECLRISIEDRDSNRRTVGEMLVQLEHAACTRDDHIPGSCAIQLVRISASLDPAERTDDRGEWCQLAVMEQQY